MSGAIQHGDGSGSDLNAPFNFEGGKGLFEKLRTISNLSSAGGVLDYDQACFLPDQAAYERSQQIGAIAEVVHERATAVSLQDQINSLYEQRTTFTPDDRRNIEILKRDLDRELKLPTAFVVEKANLQSAGYNAWESAKAAGDWKSILPIFEHWQKLWRQEADLVGYSEHPYDAHLNQYEPGMTRGQVASILSPLPGRLAPLIEEAETKTLDNAALLQVPEIIQEKIVRAMLNDLGFDFSRGRIDRAEHPFCTNLSTNDVRIGYRINESLTLGIATVAHEFGHALYALNLPSKFIHTPIANSASYGVDESQSRLWENLIGRSPAFSQYLHSLLERVAPEYANQTTPDSLWREANVVRPGLIRVDADEATYNLHIVIRFEIESALVDGTLAAKDVPERWNELYKQHLGLTPLNHTEGVLQDPHWFGGDMGYFPTYSLGNLYAAELMEKARTILPELDQQISRGNFREMRDWLVNNIHSQGAKLEPLALMTEVLGAPPASEAFIRHLRAKFDLT